MGNAARPARVFPPIFVDLPNVNIITFWLEKDKFRAIRAVEAGL